MDNLKTPASQLKASFKYYNNNKDEINKKRQEYFKEYNKNRNIMIKENEEKRLSRNKYNREYRQKKKALLEDTRDPLICDQNFILHFLEK